MELLDLLTPFFGFKFTKKWSTLMMVNVTRGAVITYVLNRNFWGLALFLLTVFKIKRSLPLLMLASPSL